MAMSSVLNQLYEFGPFRIDTEERVLLRDGNPVALTPKVFDTLLVLVRNRGHIVTKDEMMSSLWPDAFVEESNLTFNIRMLRKALGEDAHTPAYIETVPRRGYRFKSEVKEVSAPAFAMPDLTPEVEPDTSNDRTSILDELVTARKTGFDGVRIGAKRKLVITISHLDDTGPRKQFDLAPGSLASNRLQWDHGSKALVYAVQSEDLVKLYRQHLDGGSAQPMANLKAEAHI